MARLRNEKPRCLRISKRAISLESAPSKAASSAELHNLVLALLSLLGPLRSLGALFPLQLPFRAEVAYEVHHHPLHIAARLRSRHQAPYHCAMENRDRRHRHPVPLRRWRESSRSLSHLFFERRPLICLLTRLLRLVRTLSAQMRCSGLEAVLSSHAIIFSLRLLIQNFRHDHQQRMICIHRPPSQRHQRTSRRLRRMMEHAQKLSLAMLLNLIFHGLLVQHSAPISRRRRGLPRLKGLSGPLRSTQGKQASKRQRHGTYQTTRNG